MKINKIFPKNLKWISFDIWLTHSLIVHSRLASNSALWLELSVISNLCIIFADVDMLCRSAPIKAEYLYNIQYYWTGTAEIWAERESQNGRRMNFCDRFQSPPSLSSQPGAPRPERTVSSTISAEFCDLFNCSVH